MQQKNNGFVLPVLLITIFFVLTMIAVVSSFSVTSYSLSAQQSYRVNAQLAADAGLDVGINKLNIDPDWTGSINDPVYASTLGEVTVLDTPELRTTYESELRDGAEDDERILSVVARSYAPSDADEPKIERRYELDLQAVTSGTSITSVVSGVGGLTLRNNSKITGGDVVVNGTIDMSNQSQIGTQSNAVNVVVADQSCPKPANATYPTVCPSGGDDPISMSNNARIYGNVQANNQTDDDNMSNPGLTANSGVAPIALPEYDRSIHSGATEYSPNSSQIRCPNNGDITWPANIKINGNVNLGNNCDLTIRGDVWITGTFSTGNNGEITIDDSVGTSRPVIMVDGQNGFTLSNNGEIIPNSFGTGIELRTFWSHSSSGCSPDCTNLTGPGLANSQSQTTIDLGNNGDAPNSVFIAQWSRVEVSNNGALGAVAGQSIYLGNQAVINFTASVPGSDNLTVTWVKRGYIRVYE